MLIFYNAKVVCQGWKKFNIKTKIISLNLRTLCVIINKYQKYRLIIYTINVVRLHKILMFSDLLNVY